MILDQMVSDNREVLETRQRRIPLTELQEIVGEQLQPLDFDLAIKGNDIKLIAEVKKASPSRGTICRDFDYIGIAQKYATGGAAAISVLTEPQYFQGSLEYLKEIRKTVKDIPLLRKDFIFDPYQIYEARAYGADAILLIVAILTLSELRELLALSHELGMRCLVEVHSEDELEEALESGARIIGINNRDLHTFDVDISTTQRLRPLIPYDRIVVSESGIKNRSDILKLRQCNVDAALIGEALMSASDIVIRMRELITLDPDNCG